MKGLNILVLAVLMAGARQAQGQAEGSLSARRFQG